MHSANRRAFLRHTGSVALAATAGNLAGASARASGSNQRVRLGVIGCGGRGSGVAQNFAEEATCEVVAVCDPDERRAGSLAESLAKISESRRPAVMGDPRKVFDSPQVDAVLIATPDHWHAPAAIMACMAGKHVYVEKPCSHNVREGRLLVEAARRNQRVVQHGTQSRSMELIANAVQMLREGIIGDVLVAKAWNVQRRGSIGRGQPSEPPANVNYDLWVGPAPFVPFQANRFHYNWHWWHAFGTGDMGNDGVHELDYARWGLGVETHPLRIAALGGKYFFDDDQEFPDTQQVVFEWPGGGSAGQRRMLIFEMRIWSTNYPFNIDNGVEFYGTQGRMLVTKRNKLEVFGERNERIADARPKEPVSGLTSHHVDFLEAIRNDRRPRADIETGHLSSSLCHLGNIATRLGRTLEFDPGKEQILGDDEANGLLTRQYREGHWAVPQGV
ncbi:MAG TPA: Gfo/Idh/MocA family oxidoreductase [Planctomycetaceae bacterium]|nr:Gfo/Idh/MocA family oxidoreductase [Planctomycetaceae bacterium]